MRLPVVLLLLGTVALYSACEQATPTAYFPMEIVMEEETMLPDPRIDGPLSLEAALQGRRSVRAFTTEKLSLDDISQLLWSAQGITDPRGYRTAPSAGALYPLELYLVMDDGLFHYQVQSHTLAQLREEDLREKVFAAALRQEAILQAPVTIVITAVYARIEVKYGRARGPRYVHMEVGHAAQNILLQSVALGLGAVPIGAFEDERVQSVLGLPADHMPLYLIPVGHPR
jgi:SagB-type dehydrogenase family enzyme